MAKNNSNYEVTRIIHADRAGLIRFLAEEQASRQHRADGEKRQKDHARLAGEVAGIDVAIAALQDWQEV